MADLSGTINTIINGQISVAQSAANNANSALSRALGGGISLGDVDTRLPSIPDANVIVSGGLPSAPAVDYNFGVIPATPNVNIRDVDVDISFGAAPVAPSFIERVTPEISIPNLDASAPIINTDLSIPDAPTFTPIALPDPIDVTLPTAPDITVADFVGTDITPYIPGEAPDGAAEYKASYSSVLPEMRGFLDGVVESWIADYAPEYNTAMAQLESKIANGIDGGTAMSLAIEQQIFDRAKDRAELERERAETDLLEGMSKRGYTLPPSAISAGLNQIQQATSRNVSAAAAETAIARAKLEQEHAQFIMNLSSTLHMGLLNTGVQYASQLVQINGQALEYSKQMASLIMERYNQELEKLKAIISVAQVEAAVYDAKLKASLADITIFEAEIRAAELQKNIEKIDIEVYKARIDAEQAAIQTYLAQIQGVQARVSIEKVKVEVYGEQVKAYSTQVQASLAELEVFKAVISGDESKARLYAAQIQGYSAEISAEKAKADLAVSLVKSDVDVASATYDAYKAAVAAYVAEAQGTSSANQAQSDSYRARIEAYKAERTVAIKNIEANLSVAQLQAQSSIASMETRAKVTVAQGQTIASYHSSMAQAAVGAGSAYASLAGSAMSGTNAIVSLAQESTG